MIVWKFHAWKTCYFTYVTQCHIQFFTSSLTSHNICLTSLEVYTTHAHAWTVLYLWENVSALRGCFLKTNALKSNSILASFSMCFVIQYFLKFKRIKDVSKLIFSLFPQTIRIVYLGFTLSSILYSLLSEEAVQSDLISLNQHLNNIRFMRSSMTAGEAWTKHYTGWLYQF